MIEQILTVAAISLALLVLSGPLMRICPRCAARKITRKAAAMFEIPDPKKSISQNKFAFKIGAKEYWLPRLKYVTGAQAAALSDAGGPDEIFSVLAPNEATKIAILDVPIADLERMFEAWQEDSGVTVGESNSSAA